MRTIIAGLACLGSLLAPVAATSLEVHTAAEVHTATRSSAQAVEPAFYVKDSRVKRLNALTQSTRRSWLYYAHDGTGGSTRLIAVDSQGDTRNSFRVSGARNVSWQDIDSGPRHSLVIGDVGDPTESRRRIAVYRVREPRSPLRASAVHARRFALTYPDGRHHARAVMVHPRSGRVFVVTDGKQRGGVYRAPRRLSAQKPNTLTRVGRAPAGVTGASYAPDGRSYVLGTATDVHHYTRDGSRTAVASNPAGVSRAKSLVVRRSGSDLLVGTTSGSPSAVYRMSMAAAQAQQQQPGAPAGLSVSNLASRTMTLNWKAPTSAGSSPIDGYQVGWGTWASPLLAGSARSMDLTNFAADTEYTLRVRAHNAAGYGPWRNVTARTAAERRSEPEPSGMPARVVASYWPTWSGTRLTALPTGADRGSNVIFLAFAGSGTSNPGGGTGAVTYNHSNFSHAQIKADIAALRADGVRVLLSVGGAGGYTHLDTDARRNAFYNSIKTIYRQIGPFDGLDWNFETNWTYQGTVYNKGVTTAKGTLPRILWISRALKNDYPGFLFTKPPSPSSEHDRTFIKAMNDQGTFDLVMPQYYDGGGPEFPNNLSFWTSASGVGTARKVAPGIIDNERYSQYGSGTGTQASIVTRWKTAKTTYPGLRGAMYWHVGIDAQTAGGSQAYWFAHNFGATVRNR